MVPATDKLIRQFARGYERGTGSARYIASLDFSSFISELASTFQGIRLDIRRDRGQGVYLSILSAETRETLYFTRVRNINGRGLDRSPVRYSLEITNRDIVLEFS
jgi:hypothetical protein